jgi:hypothetical protein
MWSKLDDGLLDHRKVFLAGDALGRNGPGLVIGMYAIALMWTNKQLTDGFLPMGVVRTLGHFDKPLAVAEALVAAGLFETAAGGYRIHDFHDYNPAAVEAKSHRQHVSAARAKAGINGARARWQKP